MAEDRREELELEADSCEFMFVHEEIVDRVVKVMPDEGQLMNLAEFFKIFGDSTRIKILYVLSQSEMCVCDIATLLQMGQFSSVEGVKTDAPCEVQKRWENRVLQSGRRPYPDNFSSGYGTY